MANSRFYSSDDSHKRTVDNYTPRIERALNKQKSEEIEEKKKAANLFVNVSATGDVTYE